VKVSLIGVGRRVGSRLAAEELKRGQTVTCKERSPELAGERPGPVIEQGNATQPSILALPITSHDAVMSTVRNVRSGGAHRGGEAGVKRLHAFGWAGGLGVVPVKALWTRQGSHRLSSLRAGSTGREHPRHKRRRFTVGS
jgi:putative NADH-flavin reductase